MAGLGLFFHRHGLRDTEEFFVESSGILHEVVPGADAQSVVIVFDVSLSKVDQQVFVQMNLAAEITTKKVKGKRE